MTPYGRASRAAHALGHSFSGRSPLNKGLAVSGPCLESAYSALTAFARGPLPLDPASSALQPLPDLPSPARPLVAVLPFVPNGEDPSLRLMCTELADRLRERLAQDPAVQAILISSDFLAKAPPHALELICRELGVGHLISGKCHGTGKEPSVYIELTDTRDWCIRWADFYAGGARALLAQDGEAMGRVAQELRGELLLLQVRR